VDRVYVPLVTTVAEPTATASSHYHGMRILCKYPPSF
jgi:hypothetical protein